MLPDRLAMAPDLAAHGSTVMGLGKGQCSNDAAGLGSIMHSAAGSMPMPTQSNVDNTLAPMPVLANSKQVILKSGTLPRGDALGWLDINALLERAGTQVLRAVVQQRPAQCRDNG